jgi:hypothetical protein
MPLRDRYLIVGYTQDGEHAGYFKAGSVHNTGSLTSIPAKADWCVTEASAQQELERLKLDTDAGWGEYIWTVERVKSEELVTHEQLAERAVQLDARKDDSGSAPLQFRKRGAPTGDQSQRPQRGPRGSDLDVPTHPVEMVDDTDEPDEDDNEVDETASGKVLSKATSTPTPSGRTGKPASTPSPASSQALPVSPPAAASMSVDDSDDGNGDDTADNDVRKEAATVQKSAALSKAKGKTAPPPVAGASRKPKPGPTIHHSIQERIAKKVGVKVGVLPKPNSPAGRKAEKEAKLAKVASLAARRAAKSAGTTAPPPLPPAKERVTAAATPKRKPGRPSKVAVAQTAPTTTKTKQKFTTTRGPGRPSKVTKPKSAPANTPNAPKRKPGRPKGSKNKVQRQVAEKVMRPCLCGCASETATYFLRGHIARFNSQLQEIAEGRAKPSKYFTKSQVTAMGPWTNTRYGGLRPKTTDCKKLREL